MLTAEEEQYLSWVTAATYEGFGAVVDLGPWLGASTAALAHGLEECGSDRKVLAYDLFEWRDHYMTGYVDAATAAGFADGDSFLPLFAQQTRAYGQRIECRPGSLLDAGWDEGPIEILFVDAAKDWALTNAIFATFGPALVPGRSRVIAQDFRTHATYWLPYVFDGHPGQWREVERVRRGSTVTFTPLCEWVPTVFRDQDLDLRRAEPIFRARIDGEVDENRIHFANSLYRIAVLRGDHAAMERLGPELARLAACNRNADAPAAVAAAACQQLLAEGWAALAAGDHVVARRAAATVTGHGIASAEARYLDGLAGGDEAVADAPPPSLRLRAAAALTAAGRAADATREVMAALEHPEPPLRQDVGRLFEALEGIWQSAPPPDPSALLARLESRHRASAPFWFLRALVECALGNVAAARDSVGRALALDPGHARAQDLRRRLGGS
ncbi:MAG: hypothetical protein KDC98_22895 [Planctomycetes bacterium]|nr:hypothetical protein [Planctomycetota bacterium]